MNEKTQFLYSNIKDPIHWRVSEIILEQSSKNPNLKTRTVEVSKKAKENVEVTVQHRTVQ